MSTTQYPAPLAGLEGDYGVPVYPRNLIDCVACNPKKSGIQATLPCWRANLGLQSCDIKPFRYHDAGPTYHQAETTARIDEGVWRSLGESSSCLAGVSSPGTCSVATRRHVRLGECFALSNGDPGLSRSVINTTLPAVGHHNETPHLHSLQFGF